MAGLLSYGNPRAQRRPASHALSDSAGWELISSPPNSPLPQSRDDVFGLEEIEVRSFSLLGSAFESSGFLHDDYFSCGADKADLVPISVVMGANTARSDEAAVSSDCPDGTDDSGKSSFPQTVISDQGRIDRSSSPDEASKKDEAIANLAFEWRSTASNICIETGVPSNKRFSQGDSAPELCSVPESSAFYLNSRFPSQLDAPWYEPQVNVRRMQHGGYDCGRSRCVDEGGQLVAAHDTEAFSSVLSEVSKLDAIELSESNGGGGGVVCDSWIGKQLSLWQRTNSILSLALAAAVMGLLIVGRGWQRLQAQNRNLRLQLRAKDKKITQLTCQLIHVKSSPSQSIQMPVIRVNSSLQIPQDR